MIDRSIPTSPYDSSGASVLSSYSSVNEGLSYGAIAFGSSDKLNYQLNVSKRDYNDYDAPTFYTEDHHDANATPEGHFNGVENSHSDSTSIGFGASYMLDSGFVGFSLSSFENDYGVPGEHAEGDTLIEMESDRFEFRSEIEISDKINERNKAREDKNYKLADKIRDELLDKCILIEDKDDKTTWKIK